MAVVDYRNGVKHTEGVYQMTGSCCHRGGGYTCPWWKHGKLERLENGNYLDQGRFVKLNYNTFRVCTRKCFLLEAE